MVAVAGETATEVRVLGDAATVRVAFPLTLPMAAVTVVEPAATPVATPDAVIVAIFPLASVQVADAVTSAVEPSLYVAFAMNCCVAPMARLAVAGVAAIAVSSLGEPLGLRPDEVPPQPAVANSSERQRQRNKEYEYL